MKVFPASQYVAAGGGLYSLNVNIDSESNDLQFAHVELNYDPNVLTNVTVTKGTLLGSPILDEPGAPSVTSGKVTYGAARTSGNTAVSVKGTFFTIQFRIKSSAPAGSSNVHLSNVNLYDSIASTIPNLILQNGSVNVTSSCLGDLNGDGNINFNDFTLFAAAYGTYTGNPNYNPLADLDHDGNVGFDDFTTFASVYGTSCSH